MGLNWVEDIVAHLYQIKGYMVMQDVDMPMPRTEGRTIGGHSDIDILAVNSDEIIHVECQSWWGPGPEEQLKEEKRLIDRFDHAPTVIKKMFPFLKQTTFKKIFVTSGKPRKGLGKGPWSRLDVFCRKAGIELLEINDIVRELIFQLKKKYPDPSKVGKEPPLARFLLHMLHTGFLKEDS